ncbi:MAG: hypothetical protein ACAI35_05820 [Candidatus Methylacidiphilales bacterium]|nr:hypothetical protein [Candidatus Methylacidiphilales bacterium]
MDTELYEHLKKGLTENFKRALEYNRSPEFALAAAESAKALIALETLQLQKQEALRRRDEAQANH